MAHKCTRDFARALIDPVNYNGPDLCLPSTLLPLPSFKFRSTAQITVSNPPGGWGHIVVSPQSTYSATTSPILYTNNAYSGSSLIPTAVTTGVFGTGVRSPNTLNRPAVAARLVTWGMECRNVTALLNRGGAVLAYSHPEHVTLAGANAADVPSNPSASYTAVHGGEQCFRLCGGGPVREEELSFQTTGTSVPYACFSFNGATEQTYTVTLVFHWELVTTAGASRTPSHADPGPSGSVLASVQNALENNPDHENHGAPSFFGKLKSAVHSALSGYEPKDLMKLIKPAIATALSAYTGSPQPLITYATSAMAPKPAIAAKPEPKKKKSPKKR